jgi:hypothetical protein
MDVLLSGRFRLFLVAFNAMYMVSTLTCSFKSIFESIFDPIFDPSSFHALYSLYVSLYKTME